MSYNQYKGVIHKHLVKDDPCWENYEMVGTKVQDGKEVPNCVPKKEKDDEPVKKLSNLEATTEMHEASMELARMIYKVGRDEATARRLQPKMVKIINRLTKKLYNLKLYYRAGQR